MLSKLSIFILFFTISLFPHKIVYTDITEKIYKKNEIQYTIKAKTKVENFKKDVKSLFLNRKKYVSQNFYYKDGLILNEKYNIRFKRMFIYGQNIYIKSAKGSFYKYTFRAKKVVVYRDRIVFSHIFFKSSTKRGSKLKFIYYFDKKSEI